MGTRAAAPRPGRSPATIGAFLPGGLRTISANSLANPTVVTVVGSGHGLVDGDTVVFASTNSTPNIDGLRTVTKVTDNTFSVPVNVTVAGTAGTFKPAIVSASIANPTVITTGIAHGLRTGDTVTIAGSNSTPTTDSTYTVTVTGARTFTIPVNVTVAGSAGNYTKVTFNTAVVDRGGCYGGGAVVITSLIGTAANTITANIQGSADGITWYNIPYSLVATPRTFVVTALTITTSTTVTYLLQELVFWRYMRVACSSNTNIALTSITAVYAETA